MSSPSPAPAGAQQIEWRVDSAPVDYPAALADMEARAAAIFEGRARERVWLLEHPPLYTAGTSAHPAELIDPRFPVHEAGRGGRYTYHGPGQRIGYLNIDLRQRGKDVRNFVHHLEGWMIDALADLGVAARRADGRIGIWTDDLDGREAKIGAHPSAALGDAAWIFDQCGPRSIAFRGHCAVRAGGISGHQPCGAGEDSVDGCFGRRA
jgi:lipoyl(octanoyl) transferase